MKKNYITILLVLLFFKGIHAQVYLDTNNVRALIPSTPQLFWDGVNAGSFHVPKTGSKGTIFVSTPWIGGISNSNLYLAAETYRQSGKDFQSGPVSTVFYLPDASKWSVVKISRSTIEAYKANPALWTNPPEEFLNWPAHGDLSRGQSAKLAPFVNVGGDPDTYEPSLGDYPKIKGDQCTYYIFNDDFTHGESGGEKMKVEVHRMVYAYSDTNSFLNNSVFVEYKLFNRSALNYDETIFTIYSDYDIGGYLDDFVGSDSALNMTYGYNGNSNDVGGYGLNPPAEGMILLNKKMENSMYFRNDFTTWGNPKASTDFYNYMNSVWTDDGHLMYGDSGISGHVPAYFAYPGSPCSTEGWTESSGGNLPGDRRILASIPKFSFSPNAPVSIEFAYLFARGSSGPSSSVCNLYADAAKLIDWYGKNNPSTGYEEVVKKEPGILIYPNPSEKNFIVRPDQLLNELTIYDLNGKEMRSYKNVTEEINIDGLLPGVYILKAQAAFDYTVKKVMVK